MKRTCLGLLLSNKGLFSRAQFVPLKKSLATAAASIISTHSNSSSLTEEEKAEHARLIKDIITNNLLKSMKDFTFTMKAATMGSSSGRNLQPPPLSAEIIALNASCKKLRNLVEVGNNILS